ncbi:MAG: class I SAM-dependent methyltransferase [Kofleriaceae bacterium]
MTVQSKRTLKIEKLARIYDEEIAPVWGARFGKMLLRNLDLPERGQVLDISCGTGYPTVEILRRMNDTTRLIAIDASSAMLDVARRKVADLGPLGKKGVFFRTESAVPKLSFADEVYDLVVCNLGLGEMPDLDSAVRDFARVAKLGGEVRCTLPLAGTFLEFHDLYREVLIKHDKHDALDRLEAVIAKFPTIDQVERSMAAANLEGTVEIEEFALLFKSSREFFFAPVIEYGPLPEWKNVAGGGQEMQDVFWYIKEAIDAYFEGRPFQVTVRAGCMIGRKRELEPPVRPSPAEITADDPVFAPSIDLPSRPIRMASGSIQTVEDHDGVVIDEHSHAEQELDAFIEGRKRPPHLSES